VTGAIRPESDRPAVPRLAALEGGITPAGRGKQPLEPLDGGVSRAVEHPRNK